MTLSLFSLEALFVGSIERLGLELLRIEGRGNQRLGPANPVELIGMPEAVWITVEPSLGIYGVMELHGERAVVDWTELLFEWLGHLSIPSAS